MYCYECEWFASKEVEPTEQSRAICKRYPPVADFNQPLMIGSDWCGEFKRKETT
jgi:hypothetical protein